MGAKLITSKSIGEISYRRPLRECSIEELAVEQTLRNPSGGVLFARKASDKSKSASRLAVLNLFGPDRHPNGLSLLTLPGLDWKFERKLLGLREGNWFYKKGPHRTHLTCIENDRMIYRAGVVQIPGINNKHSYISMLPAPAFAESAVMNKWIGRYFFGNVDDLMKQQVIPFDGAWLDYTGPMNLKRLKIISEFYANCIKSTLVITSLKARWSRETSNAIEHAGSYSKFILNNFDGKVEHDIDYQDGSPMSQIAITKT